jgi:predicted ferric reductase
MKAQPSEDNLNNNTPLKIVAGIFITIMVLILLALVLIAVAPQTSPVHQWLNTLLAIDSQQVLWFVTRSSGIIAFLLLWLSTVWGLVISNKILSPVLQGIFSFDFHEVLSLLAIGFTVLHIGVLLFDSFLPFSLVQILVPFASTYRDPWVGIGIIGFYLMLLVSVTFYMRRQIGQKAFRAIHFVSYVSYVGVTLHSIFTGTDSVLPAAQVMYAGTALVVVFMTVYRIVISTLDKREKEAKAAAQALAKAQSQLKTGPQARVRTVQNPAATRHVR